MEEEIQKELNLFLDKMAQKGYKRVAINCHHPNIPHSLPDGSELPHDYEGVVFSAPDNHNGHWPAIWAVCEEMKEEGYSDYYGCGNGQQHQAPERLPAGYYELVNGSWIKLYSPEEEKKIMEEDLFETPEKIPSHIMDILATFDDGAELYQENERIKKEIEKHGYTFDYDLSGTAYGLRKMK